MTGRRVLRRALTLQGAVLILTAMGAIALSVKGTEPVEGRQRRFLLPSSAGDVIFDHAGHAANVEACPLCHHEATVKDIEIQSCRNCLAEESATSRTLPCDECHLFTQEDAEMEHHEMVEAHENCTICHRPCDVATAYHKMCTECHGRIDRGRFLSLDGTGKCGWCHLR